MNYRFWFSGIIVFLVCSGGVSFYFFRPHQEIAGSSVLTGSLPKGTIFIAHHRPFWVYQSEIYQPIQVGKKISSHEQLDMPGDDLGDNISEKNPFYCELTGMYWAWKNRKTQDFVGFFHYRRYLDAGEGFSERSTYRTVFMSQLLQGAIPSSVFIQEETLCRLMQEYDVLVPSLLPSDPSKISQSDQYCFGHNYQDWNALMGLLLEKYPHHQSIMNKVFEGCAGYPGNCFVMRDSLFQEYANWLFPLLFELEKRIEIQHEDPYQKRVFGFVSERLFTLFIEIKRQESNIRIKGLPLMQIAEP